MDQIILIFLPVLLLAGIIALAFKTCKPVTHLQCLELEAHDDTITQTIRSRWPAPEALGKGHEAQGQDEDVASKAQAQGWHAGYCLAALHPNIDCICKE